MFSRLLGMVAIYKIAILRNERQFCLFEQVIRRCASLFPVNSFRVTIIVLSKKCSSLALRKKRRMGRAGVAVGGARGVLEAGHF
jgi:hypothetical protein